MDYKLKVICYFDFVGLVHTGATLNTIEDIRTRATEKIHHINANEKEMIRRSMHDFIPRVIACRRFNGSNFEREPGWRNEE